MGKVINIQHKVGNYVGGSYTGFEQDGTMVAHGEAVCYRDEYPSYVVPASGAAAPDSVGYTIGGVHRQLYSFDGVNTEERLSGSFEIPHDYQYGGVIEVHIHWRPSTTGIGNVKWFLDWEHSSPESVPMSGATLFVVDNIPSNEQFNHKLVSIGTFPTNIEFKIGCKIGFNLRRTPSDDQDTYGADALFEQIALHIPIDTLGSRQRYVK